MRYCRVTGDRCWMLGDDDHLGGRWWILGGDDMLRERGW